METTTGAAPHPAANMEATLHGADVAVVVVYLASVLGVGLWASIRGRHNSTSDYFLGGRSMHWVLAQHRFKKSLYGDNAESTPRETQAGSDGCKAHGESSAGKRRCGRNGDRFWRCRPRISRLCADPRIGSVVTPRELGSAMRAAGSEADECECSGRGPGAGQRDEQHDDGEHAVYKSQWGICEFKNA
ncbi:hypothetical protein HPB49_010657 [Dermacentor silvarum]|uniref:Uncharacterized protein n=1 Tax=Dermacentor silvarum TaxID=543639 RepID=A0ACB8D476_DERSI|nr:hypothetical protein HPB49_010657 [Dermacentor silvarum]